VFFLGGGKKKRGGCQREEAESNVKGCLESEKCRNGEGERGGGVGESRNGEREGQKPQDSELRMGQAEEGGK